MRADVVVPPSVHICCLYSFHIHRRGSNSHAFLLVQRFANQYFMGLPIQQKGMRRRKYQPWMEARWCRISFIYRIFVEGILGKLDPGEGNCPLMDTCPIKYRILGYGDPRLNTAIPGVSVGTVGQGAIAPACRCGHRRAEASKSRL